MTIAVVQRLHNHTQNVKLKSNMQRCWCKSCSHTHTHTHTHTVAVSVSNSSRRDFYCCFPFCCSSFLPGFNYAFHHQSLQQLIIIVPLLL